MPTYARYIFINGRRYDTKCSLCKFTWSRDVGCESGELFLPGVEFDDFANIEIGDRVELRYGTSYTTRWFTGYVSDLRTELPCGLTVTLQGMFKYLMRMRPSGRFGSQVETKAPTDLAASSQSTGGSLGAGTWRYQVTSLDPVGETVPGTVPSPGSNDYVDVVLTGSTNVVTVTWAEAQGARGYRVYRKESLESTWTYWDVSELTFVDDNTSAGTDLGVGNSPPVASTATTPTIAGVYVDDVVNYLLDTYLPSDVTKGSVTAGDDTELDDYDLTDSTASLWDVLRALADIVGDTVCGVDNDGAAYFVPEPTPNEDSPFYAEPDYIFYIGKDNAGIAHLQSLSRSKTEDTFTFIKPEGEEQLDDPDENTGGVETDDVTEYPNYATYGWPPPIFGIHGWGRGRPPGGPRLFMSLASLRAGLIAFGSVAAFPNITTRSKYFFLNTGDDSLKVPSDTVDGATLEQWFYFLPTLFWLYTQLKDAAKIRESFITKMLTQFDEQITYVKETRSDTLEDITEYEAQGATPIRAPTASGAKTAPRMLPGVKTSRLAGQAAVNELLRFTPQPEQWDAGLRNVQVLFKPGLHLIRIHTQKGVRYDLQLQRATYAFDDKVSASLTIGQPEYTPEDELEDIKKVVYKLATRTRNTTTWRPNSVYL